MTEPAGPPSLYPVSLDVSGRPCLVVGGGPVAARKARALARLRRIGDRDRPVARATDMEALVPSLHAVERRPYRPGDASAFRLVVTATGRPRRRRRRLRRRRGGRRLGQQCRRPRPLLLHPPGGPPRRRGDRVRVHRRAEPGAGLVAPEPPRRPVRRGSRDPGRAPRRGPRASSPCGCAQRLGRLERPCSTARCPSWCSRGTWRAHKGSWTRPAALEHVVPPPISSTTPPRTVLDNAGS